MKSRRWCTAGKTKKILLVVWFVAVLLSAPTLYIMDIETNIYYNNFTSVTKMTCADIGVDTSARLGFAIYKQLIMFSIPSVIMVVCYTAVIYALWVSSRQLTKLTASSSCSSTLSIERVCMRPQNPTYSNFQSSPYRFRKYNIRNGVKDHSVEILRARRQVIKMLVAVVLVFLICWGPKLIFEVLKRLELSVIYTQEAFIAKLVLECLPYIQSSLNPIIYGFMSRNFRRSLVAACRRYCYLCKFIVRNTTERHYFPDIEMDSKLSNGTVNTRMTRNSGSSEDFQCLSTTRTRNA